MSVDLSEPIRTALVGNAAIIALLPTYAGSPSIFTRRPVVGELQYPFILIPPSTGELDVNDGIDNVQPIVTYEITVYAGNADAESYRKANQITYLIKNFLHRNRSAITLSDGWSVVNIRVLNVSSTNQDDQVEGRVLTVEFHLAKKLSA